MPLGFSNPDNQEGLWASSNYTPIRPAEDADFEVITIECWKYESQNSAPTVRHKTERLSIGSIDSWLEEPYPSCEGRSLSSGFKILLMPTDGLLLPPMTEKGLNSINTALGLPHVHKHSASLSSGANGMFLQRDKSYVFVFRKTSSYSSISVILRYNPLRNVTQGVFHFEPMGIPLHYFDKLISQFSACSHPLLLPLIAVEITFELTACLLLRPALITLREIEGQTGYDINAHGDDKINLSDDLRALIQRLGDGQSKLFSALSTIRSARLSTEFIQRKLRHLNKVLPDEVKGRLEHPSDLLEERIEYLLSNMENALLYEGITERMETQQTVVFNLIAQLDGMVNIGLAKDSKEIAAASKRDSSAMKIVAVLTTFFLPDILRDAAL
ncbi:hypothetical protein BDV30DRAFT_214742 [Aspergillus minisclerotigenes]|uniref:Uncharacterized protein n=1 Tax=Aspergillus minisclerotigenes TaxID=656917 RepID=A0A5N6IXT0_9EURO|nr:hypothetical protein BDV30DRAFT_214742 [Aspergillus minisclerotigenes]